MPYSFNNVADIRNLQQYCSIEHYQSGRTKAVSCGSWFQEKFRLLDVVLELRNIKVFQAAEVIC